MKKTITFLIFILFFFQVYTQTGTITNISVQPRTDGSGMVDVYFDLSGEAVSYNILIEVSFDAGANYTPIPTSFLSGDLTAVSPGSRHVLWDGYESFPDEYSTQTRLKITATHQGINQYENDFTTDPGITVGNYNPNHPLNFFIYDDGSESILFSTKRTHISYGVYGGYPYWFDIPVITATDLSVEFDITFDDILDGYWGTNAVFLISNAVYDEVNAGISNSDYLTNALGIVLRVTNRDGKKAPTVFPVIYKNGTTFSDSQNSSQTLPLYTKLTFKVTKSNTILTLEIYNGNDLIDLITHDLPEDLYFDYDFTKMIYTCGHGGLENNNTFPYLKGKFNSLRIYE